MLGMDGQAGRLPLVTSGQLRSPLVDVDPILEIFTSMGFVDSNANSSTVSRLLNIQTRHSPSGNLIELDLPKDACVYNSKSFMKMLKKYELPPGHLYRVHHPSERISGSDPKEVVVYRDSMTAGLRFPLHPLFVSFFNEFHVTPGQLTPNSWRISTYFLYLCLTNDIEPCLKLFRKVVIPVLSRSLDFLSLIRRLKPEIMLGCVNEKLIENFKNKEAGCHATYQCIPTTCRILDMEEKVLRNFEKFEKCAAEKDHDKKKAVADMQSLLDKATTASNKKDSEIAHLHKDVDQLRKKLEIADDEAIVRYKMSVEYKSSLHMYGAEFLKAAIKMTKEWLVDDHSKINPYEFVRYLRKHRAANLAAQKAKVTNHGGVGSQPDGSLDN
ncbi:Uncharacterized protein Adt_39791 [Abeliophyllum distichum]|uniref:Transposase (putative) gypsy type domain-containing protein n=1 Tax=Abeliophyllum distichum TaxID=126358 RepID=A0ABD1Q6A2_9LAMI